ncbi:MAG: hypothetical protein KBE21_04825 [Acetoanaerobium sp.]|nr:hypothetical protein [Acetoanaerobium sp.]
MGQSIRIIKNRIIEYSPMIKINYSELNKIINCIEEIMYGIHKIPFVWPNYESDEGIELNKEPLNLLALGENRDIILNIKENESSNKDNTEYYHNALDFLRKIKKELQDTPMENEEYIRIEFFN